MLSEWLVRAVETHSTQTVSPLEVCHIDRSIEGKENTVYIASPFISRPRGTHCRGTESRNINFLLGHLLLFIPFHFSFSCAIAEGNGWRTKQPPTASYGPHSSPVRFSTPIQESQIQVQGRPYWEQPHGVSPLLSVKMTCNTTVQILKERAALRESDNIKMELIF